MRISFINGEDSAKAYNRYRELVDQSRAKGFDIIQITDLHNIVSQSLFEDRVVFTLDKSNKIKLTDWKWLSKNASKYNSNLLIFFEGSAGVTVTRNLPKDAKQEKFELPKIIFSFLDSIYPGNSKTSLRLFNELVKDQPSELILAMMARQLRDLYWASVSPQTLKSPGWIAKKLEGQVKRIGKEKIREMINELSEIDIKTKTSKENLKTLLDLFIVKHLE